MGRAGAAVWMRHHGFGVDTSEACHPVRPSPALSGSVQGIIHMGDEYKCCAEVLSRITVGTLVYT